MEHPPVNFTNGSNVTAINCTLIRGCTALAVALLLLAVITIVIIYREFRTPLAGERSCPFAIKERLFIYVNLGAILPSIGFVLHCAQIQRHGLLGSVAMHAVHYVITYKPNYMSNIT